MDYICIVPFWDYSGTPKRFKIASHLPIHTPMGAAMQGAADPIGSNFYYDCCCLKNICVWGAVEVLWTCTSKHTKERSLRGPWERPQIASSSTGTDQQRIKGSAQYQLLWNKET